MGDFRTYVPLVRAIQTTAGVAAIVFGALEANAVLIVAGAGVLGLDVMLPLRGTRRPPAAAVSEPDDPYADLIAGIRRDYVEGRIDSDVFIACMDNLEHVSECVRPKALRAAPARGGGYLVADADRAFRQVAKGINAGIHPARVIEHPGVVYWAKSFSGYKSVDELSREALDEQDRYLLRRENTSV